MPTVRFEPAITEHNLPQTCALDRTVTGSGSSRGLFAHMINVGAGWRCVVNVTSFLIYPRVKEFATLRIRGWVTPEPAWVFRR